VAPEHRRDESRGEDGLRLDRRIGLRKTIGGEAEHRVGLYC
jgi:hypothetical protein